MNGEGRNREWGRLRRGDEKVYERVMLKRGREGL